MNLQRLTFGALAALLAASSGCDDTSNLIAVQLNFDRPVDVAFTCYGGLRLSGGQEEILSATAQPLASCDIRSAARKTDEPVVLPPGQEDRTASGGAAVNNVFYLGLILQSGPGTVALSQFPADRAATYDGNEVTIIDSDPLTPTKNSISVGSRPIAIGTDPSGCHAVTANAGSCDLSALDINSALELNGQAKVTRFDVAGIKARPAAMVLQPNAGTGAQIVGQVCPAKPSGLAYVAYPACNAVAVVDLADGSIKSGIQFALDGTATIVPTISCAVDECGLNQAVPPGPHPSTLDLVRDDRVNTERLVIGGRDSNRITVVDLDRTTHLPTTVSQVELQEPMMNTLGVLNIALSPQIGMGGSSGFVDDNGDGMDDLRIPPPNNDPGPLPQFQFAYAVATDGTLRVASVLPGNLNECDTQVDPRFLYDVTDMNVLSCLPVSQNRPRRAGAQGPGLLMPRDSSSDGIPSAVTISRFDRAPDLPDDTVFSSSRLIGYYGVVTSTTGATYVVEVDDDFKPDAEIAATPLLVDISTVLPHRLRDQVFDRGARPESTPEDGGNPVPVCNSSGPGGEGTGAARGGSRMIGAFSRLNLPEVLSTTKISMLPNMQHYLCTASDATLVTSELSFTAPPEAREDRFPDNQALASNEDWRLLWEGPLSLDTINQDTNGPSIRLGGVRYDGADFKVFDRSKPYCALGVEPYDQVQLLGCNPLATFNDCPTGSRCFLHPESTTGVGACLPEKTADSLAGVCRDFLVSVRRYTVAPNPKSNELVLKPRPRVLRSTPLSGCISDQQCADLATYEARQATDRHPFEDTTAAVGTYSCRPDANRKEGTLNRCVRTCTRDLDCGGALACDEGTGTCMEGPLPPPECVAGIQRYDIRASEAFTLNGTQSGYVHPIVSDNNGFCVKNPAASILQVGRIPLKAPPCSPTIPGRTDLTGPNPCSTTVTEHYEVVSNYASDPPAAPCALGSEETRNQKFENVPAIFVRLLGMNFHIVSPTYPGDAQCRGDRRGSPLLAGALDIPSVFVGLAMQFRIIGGALPLPIRTSAVVPVRVLRGPQQSIWIVDEGDFIAESSGAASTRGKVFRVEGFAITIVNTMQ